MSEKTQAFTTEQGDGVPAIVPGYDGLADSLMWLKATIDCKGFNWDEDQRAAAAESLLRGEAELQRVRQPR